MLPGRTEPFGLESAIVGEIETTTDSDGDKSPLWSKHSFVGKSVVQDRWQTFFWKSSLGLKSQHNFRTH